MYANISTYVLVYRSDQVAKQTSPRIITCYQFGPEWSVGEERR